MTKFARNLTLAAFAAAAVIAPLAPATAAPVVGITAETPVQGIDQVHYVEVKADEMGLTTTSRVYTYLENGTEWVFTDKGILVANPDDTIYTGTTLPTTGERVVTAPREAKLRPSTPAAGAVYVKGAIKDLYLSQDGQNSFGDPWTNETATFGGVKQEVRVGSAGKITDFYWKSGIGAKNVGNSIRAKVTSVGGIGVTGFPTTQEVKTSTGAYQKFEKGTMTYTNGVGTSWKANA